MVTNVLDYLENSEKDNPGKVVFSEGNKSIVYSDLSAYGKRLGSFILDKTNNSGRNPIVVFVDRNIESLVSFIAVAYSGNFYVPIDRQLPRLRIENIIRVLQPVAAIVTRSDMQYAGSVSPDLLTVVYEEGICFHADDERLNKVRNSIIDTDPLYATFTSGSTGIPKGVLTCHRSVIDMTEALFGTFDFSGETVFGNQNPFYFDASIKDIYSTLKCGATMYIIPKTCFVLPATLVEFLKEHEINTILWSAAAIALVANTGAFDKDVPLCLRRVMFSGEVMHNKVLNYWRRSLPGAMFVNLYGPTEITSVCTYYIADIPYSDEEVLPIGKPFKNTEILLLNEDNHLVKGEEIGEICVRGCCLALGYFNNPEKTAEAFCQNPVHNHYPETIYRTGDLARYDKDGQIIFLTRKDNQVKHMGQRVELGEIEILVNSLDLIDASICFYDHDKQKIVLVYRGKKADKKYILDGIKDRLPKYIFPNIILEMEDLPYNLNGKIDRTLLKDKYNKGEIN